MWISFLMPRPAGGEVLSGCIIVDGEGNFQGKKPRLKAAFITILKEGEGVHFFQYPIFFEIDEPMPLVCEDNRRQMERQGGPSIKTSLFDGQFFITETFPTL
jgi:hypothetical protein